jgi:hypothetical protein
MQQLSQVSKPLREHFNPPIPRHKECHADTPLSDNFGRHIPLFLYFYHHWDMGDIDRSGIKVAELDDGDGHLKLINLLGSILKLLRDAP